MNWSQSPTDNHAVLGEPAVEPVAGGIARRLLATHIMGPEDDIPRRYCRTRGKPGLKEDNSTVVGDNASEFAWKPQVLFDRVGDSGNDRVERNLEDEMQASHARLADDQLNLQPDKPIGKNLSLVEERN